jgi:signal transduction histidine kinase/CheY-like chemotaxis protein
MNTTILTIKILTEHDVVLARQRARQIAGLLGFESQDQTRIATAVSEMARNALNYAGGGKVEFLVEDLPRQSRDAAPPQMFLIRISDEGPGIANLPAILDGKYTSETGMGFGIIGAKRLMDSFHIESSPGHGTTVLLRKTLPPEAPVIYGQSLTRIANELVRHRPRTTFEEIQLQNQELLRTLDELRRRQEELAQLNRELEDTNRGVLALYAELDEKATQLRRANEMKSRFLSNMSHEFRTPLNSILSLSQILLDRLDGELTAEQEKQVTFIRKSAETLSELVNDLLDIAKIEAGKIEVRPSRFEVTKLLSSLRGMFRPIHINTSVELIFEEPVGIPPLNSDEGKISQILRNLISNALKFTERGEVHVSAKLNAQGKAVVFSVADTGIGIAPEYQEHIFEEFIQLDSPLQRRVKGTGLGLPLSRKLAELLGGSLTVKSEVGVGSTFSAVIPLVYGERVAESSVVEGSLQLDATRFPILVVEDNPADLLFYEKYLKGSGFQIIPVRTTKEARQAMKRIRPTAIILDILLPEEDGWNFLAEVKGDEVTWDIPILVVTIVDDKKDKGIVLGADDYCVKPIERNWLLNKLKQLAPVEKILIIDDEEAARYAFKKFLTDTRYTVIEAADGPEGIRRAREEQPHVIFLDLVMPEMSGFEVLNLLKSDPTTHEIPVIIYTAKVLEEEERSRLTKEALAILSKETTSREAAIAKIKNILAKVQQEYSLSS